MNLLSTIRRKQTRAANRVQGLFVILWLGLLLPPCAIALDADSGYRHGCPQCPSVEMHHAQAGDAGSHEHATADIPCSADSPHCAALDDYSYNGRSGDVRIKDVPTDAPVAVAPAIIDSGLYVSGISEAIASDITACPGPQRTFNILYCVYLK